MSNNKLNNCEHKTNYAIGKHLQEQQSNNY